MSDILDPDVQAIISAAYSLQAKLNALQTLPSTPLNAFLGIEKRLDWILDPKSQGADVPLGDFRFTPGTPAVFNAAAPGGPYAAGYWYLPIDNTGLLSKCVRFKYELSVQAGWGDLAAMQAFEFELQLTVAGLVFNMAWQADSISQLWRTFNYATKQWEPTNIEFDSSLMAGKFCSISAEFVINPDKSVTHSSLVINGVANALAITHVSVQSDPATANYLHAAFQLDSNGKTPPTPYSVQAEGMNVWCS